MYEKFGKVREIDGSGDTFQVWDLTRKAMLPQISFVIGPKISGKATLGSALAERTNAKLLKFGQFVKEQGLEDKDDDTVVLALINQLSKEISPRVVIADFPRTAYQAKFFVKNGTHPSRVFVLNCSKDYSQERMIQVSQTSPSYLPSSLLSKRIGEYNENLKELLPYLRENTELSEISTETPLKTSMKEMCSYIEPTVISVRSSGSKEATQAKNSVMSGLQEQGFIALEVNDLIQLEVQRQTEIGRVIQELLNSGKNVWSEPAQIVAILKKIIYSGVDHHDKFLLIGFPDQIEHAEIFEKDCANISAIVYTSNKDQPTVEVKGDDLSLKNIDTLFAKEFRLKTMNEWDASTFAEHLGKKVNWGMFTGRSFSGKKTLAASLSKVINGKVINMNEIQENLKKTLAGPDDEADSVEVPISKVEEAILELVSKDRAANQKFTYIFAEWLHPNTMDFINAMHLEFGLPSFSIHCECGNSAVNERFKKKTENDGDIGEDDATQLEESAKKAQATKEEIEAVFDQANIKNKLITLTTEGSLETTLNQLRGKFSAKVIIVNHEKRLDVDTTCSNLAIKFNMLYLSVYQCIKAHITSNSAIGKELLASRKNRPLVKDNEELIDTYDENQYSAVHFDQRVVLKMIQATIAEKRTN